MFAEQCDAAILGGLRDFIVARRKTKAEQLAAIGEAISDIATLMIADVAPDDAHLLLYTEVTTEMSITGLYADRGSYLKYKAISDELQSSITGFWASTPPRNRWIALAVIVTEERFESKFYYPGKLPAGDEFEDRLRSVLTGHFGNKRLR